MTANKYEQGSEPGRPAWAAGLDLHPMRMRATDEDLKLYAQDSRALLRRLADAEMRVAELERLLREARAFPDPGEPDYLIETGGAQWKRIGQDRYARTDGSFPGFTPDRAKIERSSDGPVRAAWK